ncbi:HNH endonuclease [Sphingomonas panni]
MKPPVTVLCPTCQTAKQVKYVGMLAYCSPECLIADRVIISSTGCWEWSGFRDHQGYGSLYWSGVYRAHRFSYKVIYGIDPGSLLVRHKCDNPPCVNPDHLELGTAQQNSDDCVSRNRQARGERHTVSVLDEKAVLAIRASSLSPKQLSKLHGVNVNTIHQVISRKTWKHI